MNTPFRSSAAQSIATIATAFALFVSSGVALTASTAADQLTNGGAWSSTDPGARQVRFVDRHGPVLTRPQLYLIYWGTGWLPTAAPVPTPARVTAAARSIVTGVYLDGLAQYRGIGRGALRGSTVVTTSDPPAGFTGDQIEDFIDDQLSAGTVPGPDAANQTLYGVVMPTGVTPEFAERGGTHGYFEHAGQRIPYAWFANRGALAAITRMVSHELVEAATDPEGSGIVGVAGTCDEPGWCEVADICESTWTVFDGVTVQAYWSNRNGECILPGRTTPSTSPSRARHPSTDRAPGRPGWEAT